MKKIIGFIGSGNMGSAIIGGIIKSGLVKADHIIASDRSEHALKQLNTDYAIRTTHDNLSVATESDILFLAVKPDIYPIVINEIKDKVKHNVTIVAIAAGQTIAAVESMFGRELKVVRIMPNTPALVGEGMTAVCPNKNTTDSELNDVMSIMSSIGKAETVSESLIHAVIGISGSCPAYIYMIIEALSDAAVSEGMPREQSYKFAAQTLLGSAKMVLETGKHPGALKDQVCSPGGTTIAAVCELEKQGLRNAIISGAKAAMEKSRQMSK